MASGWALVIFHDHRPESVKRSIGRLQPELTKAIPGITVRDPVPLRLLFGERPYHVLVPLEADSENTLVRAFDYLEHNFSHVDGFG